VSVIEISVMIMVSFLTAMVVVTALLVVHCAAGS
jgi:hypothetical protein